MHVAKLARLRISPEQVEPFRVDLSNILDHVAKLSEIDTQSVEPMTHPLSIVNRLAADLPGPTMPIESLLRNAPSAEGSFLAVPKVLADEGGGA